MTPRRSFIAASAAGIVSAASALTFDRTPSPKPGYAPVNGLRLYYEMHGSGDPLILLHGGLGASEMFAEILPELADGWYPEIRAGMAEMCSQAAERMKKTPMYQLYAHIAPKPADWPVLITKIGELLRKDYGWSNEVGALKMPTMLVFGDADAVRTAHAIEFFELLGGGQKDAGWDGARISNARLAILPRLTHYNIFSSPALASTVTPFLGALAPAVK